MSTKIFYPTIFKDIKNRYELFDINVQQLDRLICVKCKGILIEPYQTDCGCRFCSDCLQTRLLYGQICPGCDVIIEENQKEMLTYDRATEREIFQLEMKCVNELCEYKCKLKDMNEHIKSCEYNDGSKDEPAKLKCEDCGEVFSKKDFDIHGNIYGNIDSLCDNMKSICPYKCTEEVQDNIKVHLNNCTRMIVECPMKNVGCEKKFPIEEMADHVRDDVNYHMSLMMKEIDKIKNEYSKKEHSLDIDRSLLTKEICRVNEKLKLLKKSKMNHLDRTQHKYIFPHVAIDIAMVRMFNLSKEHSIVDDTIIQGYIMTFGLVVSDDYSTVCLSMKLVGTQETGTLKAIGIKWTKSESVEENHWCFLSDLNHNHASMIVKLTMTMDIFRQRIALKNHLSFIVEILDVPVEDKCQIIL